MTVRFRAGDEPARTRLDYWQHLLSSSLAPYQVRAPGNRLRGQIEQAQIGPVTVLGMQGSAMHQPDT